MDSGIMAAWVTPISIIFGGVVTWIIAHQKYRREIKRLAGLDADQSLKDTKALLEELISKTQEPKQKEIYQKRLYEINAALAGLNIKKLDLFLKIAGLPTKDILIIEGEKILNKQQIIHIKEEMEVIKKLPQSDSIEELFTVFYAHFHTKQYQEAKNIIDQIIKLNPENPRAFNNRGSTYVALEKYNEAVADFTKAIELRPDYAEAYYNRSDPYRFLQQPYKAVADLKKAVELKPDLIAAFYLIASIYSKLDKIDDALEYLEKATSKDKQFKEMAKKEKDFDNIRNDPRFKKLIGEE